MVEQGSFKTCHLHLLLAFFTVKQLLLFNVEKNDFVFTQRDITALLRRSKKFGSETFCLLFVQAFDRILLCCRDEAALYAFKACK